MKSLIELHEIADVVMGQSPPSSVYNTTGEGLPFFQGKAEFGAMHPTPSKWCSAPSKVAEPNDVLMSIRAPVGPTNIAVERSCIGRGLAAIRPKQGVRNKWLFYAFRSMEPQIDALGTGTTFKSISGQTLRQLPVPIAPVAEQDATVAEIEKQFSRLDEAVAGLQRVKANLKRYKAAVLKSAVAGRLVDTEADLARREGRSYETGTQLLQRILDTRRSQWQGKGKYKEPAAPVTTDLPELPEGWVLSSLDALLREPLRNGHSAKATDDPNGLRAFTLSAVTEGDFSEANTKRTVAESKKVSGLWAQPGDIYVERSNTPELVGTARLYDGPPNFAFIPDLLIRVRVCQTTIPRYVEIALQSETGRKYFKSHAQGISSTMPKIDQAAIESFAVPFPPLAEQHRIVAEVDRLLSIAREADAEVEANLRRAQGLRQTILTRAFRPGAVSPAPTFAGSMD